MRPRYWGGGVKHRRVGRFPEQALEPRDERGAEALGEPRSRQPQELAHLAQAHAAQVLKLPWGEPQGRQRQLDDSGAQVSEVADHRLPAPGGKHQRPARGGCQAAGAAITEVGQPGADLPDERRRPAEQAQAASDLQHQGLRRREADDRRESPAPGGEPLERGALARRLARQGAQVGGQGQRTTERLAGVHAASSGGLVTQ